MPTPASLQSKSAKPPPSFGDLARRITGWTSNLVASVLVLLLAVGVGKWLFEWDAPPPTARPAADFDLLSGGVELQFGHGPESVERRLLQGNRTDAIASLLAWCQAAAQRTALPQDPPDQRELAILQQIGGRQAVQQRGDWQIFQFNGVFPLAVATRTPPGGPFRPPAAGPDGGNPSERAPQAANPVAADARRMVAWGMAIPAGKEQWSLYLSQLSAAGAAASQVELELPPGCRRTLTLRCGDGGMIGFCGAPGASRDVVAAWQSAFEQSLSRRGLKAEAASGPVWTELSGIWHGRFVGEMNGQLARVDVQFGPLPRADASADWLGLINIVTRKPPRP